jgi:putative DNA primase/helicase
MSKLSFSNHIVDIQDIALKHGLKISKEKLTDLLIRISLDNKYNPIELYLKECKKKYDLNPNKNIFSDLCKTIKSTNNEYKVKFIGKFLLQMVWLACSKDDDQVSGQYMLVLQGKQGIGKTTWFSKLLPQKFRNEYFLGGRVLDPSNKDHIIETISNWLIEMGEITTTFKKTDQENLKNFITTNVDKVRPPFQKEAIRKKRRAVLCGTTNDSEYLRDFTGSRRFLTLECISIDKDHNVDIDQLWGYIYNLYLKGATYAFTYKEEEKIIEYNREYLSKPESLIFLEEKFILNPTEDKYDCWMTAEDIFNALGKQDIFFSKYKLARELKKYNVSSKRTHRTVFYNVKKM